MTKEEIKDVTDNCFIAHEKAIQTHNNRHLKKVKNAIFLRVTLPVTVLIALGLFMLKTINTVSVTAATHQATTNEKVDAMGINLMNETTLRRQGDINQKAENDKLEAKMDANFKYLYQNSMFKTRGGNPYMTTSK